MRTSALHIRLPVAPVSACAPTAKDGFHRHVCTDEYSWNTVLSLYQFLPSDEKEDLMRAFVKYSYEVNLACC